ncbi:MAG: ABC transporter ATP-binding protein [Phycisphaerales bacterium]|nr:ABC transporter ATP-binding protein [Phycisphaerales bacterium]
MQPAIDLQSVQKRYGEKIAVHDLTLTIPPGELFAFLGPNGAGKTTTIKMICGLLHPLRGTVDVCGHRMGVNGLAAKARIAYVPDQPFLYDKLTGREFLHFVAEMYRVDRTTRDARVADLAARLDMGDFLDKLTQSYSHGMKQKVVLAAALLHDPDVLVIDEPMVGLDPRTVRMVKDLFRERTRAGKTVFMSTHTLEIAEAVADRIGIIHNGKLIALGNLNMLRSKAEAEHTLEDIFLQLTNPLVGDAAHAVEL